MTTSSRFVRPTLEMLEDRCVPATLTVTKLADSGNGSLRQAIINSNASAANDVIVFKAGLKGTINLTSVIDITDDVKINGPGAGKIKISGQGASQIFNINGPSTLNVTISKVALLGGNAGSDGGAIANADENLTLSKITVDASSTTGDGGAVAQQSGGSLTIKNSTFSNNTANLKGGAIFLNAGTLTITGSKFFNNSAGSQGGALHTDGALDLRTSVLSGNRAATGGAINSENSTIIVDATITNNLSLTGVGGGIRHFDSGTLTIQRSTFSGNIARSSGGGIYLASSAATTITNSTIANNFASTATGGGVYVKDGNFTMRNSTVSNNAASTNGGGIYVASSDNTIEIHNSTIAFNLAHGNGGGIWADRDVTLNSTIVARNFAGGNGDDLFSNTILEDDFFASYCLIQDANLTFAKIPANATNILGQDPLLGPLQNNGGPTLTHALLPGSPAINTGSNPNGDPHDQRGKGYKRVKGGLVDIGAFER